MSQLQLVFNLLFLLLDSLSFSLALFDGPHDHFLFFVVFLLMPLLVLLFELLALLNSFFHECELLFSLQFLSELPSFLHLIILELRNLAFAGDWHSFGNRLFILWLSRYILLLLGWLLGGLLILLGSLLEHHHGLLVELGVPLAHQLLEGDEVLDCHDLVDDFLVHRVPARLVAGLEELLLSHTEFRQ